LTARQPPGVSELLRHATLDLAADDDRARAWARVNGSLESEPRGEVLDQLARIKCPTLLLWASDDPDHPLRGAEDAVDLLPESMLRVLDQTGYLIAYDDPVGVARELAAFLR
jgi:pimeloyl-ACP methyl ester carboxylesterase